MRVAHPAPSTELVTVLIEEVREDLRGAQQDELNLIKDKQVQHENRLAAIERRAGLA
jgi:hypothetical protein